MTTAELKKMTTEEVGTRYQSIKTELFDLKRKHRLSSVRMLLALQQK
jgi:ribosomal protein L29